jgi:hypothetical protein
MGVRSFARDRSEREQTSATFRTTRELVDTTASSRTSCLIDDEGPKEARWSARSTLLLILGVGAVFWGTLLWLFLG